MRLPRSPGNTRGCKCPWWLHSTLFRMDYRKSAKTLNYEAALKNKDQLARGRELAEALTFETASPLPIQLPPTIRFSHASAIGRPFDGMRCPPSSI